MCGQADYCNPPAHAQRVNKNKSCTLFSQLGTFLLAFLIVHVENKFILHCIMFCIHGNAIMKNSKNHSSFSFSNLPKCILSPLSISLSLPFSHSLFFLPPFSHYSPTLPLPHPPTLTLPPPSSSHAVSLPSLPFLSIPILLPC